MQDLSHMQYAFSHDPCRRGDRTPVGAVRAGAHVTLLLRVDSAVRDHVEQAFVELLDGEDVVRIPMAECAQGYEATVDTGEHPRVLFYRFFIETDAGDVVCARREDGRSTASCVVTADVADVADAAAMAGGGDDSLFDAASCFQLTVYDPAFEVPAWYAGCVMYQIFPDRFARGPEGIRYEGVDAHLGRGWPVHVHEDWNEQPDWIEPYEPVDFFGGTLSGIEDKLDYLQSLGVEAIYLNPIVEARSNHRYNTGDYQQVDPILGTWEGFERLATAAEARGMHIILDTVLSHTGSASRYFNLDGSYDSFGAAQGEDSPYRSWYDFVHGTQYAPYRCWWNDPTLPEVEEHDPSWQRFVFGAALGEEVRAQTVLSSHETSTGRFGSCGTARGTSSPAPRPDDNSSRGLLFDWVAHGASGFRLDVADEIPDDVLEMVRTTAKAASPDSVIIGEVWEDPTTKESYGSRRTYALGNSLDSVMNYPLRAMLLQFALGGADAQQLAVFLKSQKMNYPEPMYSGLMNLLSSHDVERVRSVLDLGMEFRDLLRPNQVAMVEGITDEADAHGSMLQRILACIIYLLPGVPCLYYGDERGLQGGRDPFDRATFPWDGWRADCGRDLTGLYQAIGKLRANSNVLKHGATAFYSYGKDVTMVLRMPSASMLSEAAAPSNDPLGARSSIDGTLLCVANRSHERIDFVVDLMNPSAGLSEEEACALRFADVNPRCVLATDESGHLPEWPATFEDGIFRSSVGPMQACIFQLDAGLQKPLGKGTGIICHITSVPNADASGKNIGPGTLGAPAKRFVDMLVENGIRFWQILPLNPTDEYGSPYAGLSAFAGNTRLLEQTGDAEKMSQSARHFDSFVERNAKWLLPYATFIAIKELQNGALWRDWPAKYRTWDPALADAPELAAGVQAEMLRQFEFECQWKDLRAYANACGVKIVGDMPIYVSADSADAWAHREYLTLDANGNLTSQGGMPPDQFSAEGQLWGNPTYDWEALRANGYDWWLDRFERVFDWYDYVRIDHFLGYQSYYSIAEGKSATEGEWLSGPGIDLFRKAYEKFGPLPVLAEDLGIITPQVKQLMAEAGFTGMDVVQFFDGDPREWWQPKPGKACFTSTHDTSTLLGWVKNRYCDGSDERMDEARAIAGELMERVRHSSADVVFLSLQDVLGLDDSSRMNVPGTSEGNWTWQMDPRGRAE